MAISPAIIKNPPSPVTQATVRSGRLSFAEIAESIGCPINTAKSRMRYALEHLRKTLKREGITQSEVTEGEVSRM